MSPIENKKKTTLLGSCNRGYYLFWNYFHHVLYFFIGDLKKKREREKTQTKRIKADCGGTDESKVLTHGLFSVFLRGKKI